MIANLIHLLSPHVIRALGWALLHFLWQGTAIAAIAATAMALSRSASVRYALGLSALALMLVAPVATFLSYAGTSSANSEPAKLSVFHLPVQPISRTESPTRNSTPSAPFKSSFDAFPWLVEAWLFGVALFSFRTFSGFLLLDRQCRRRSTTLSTRTLLICHTIQRKLGLDRTIAYCECEWLQAPAVIGWFRPIVFLPMTALTGLSEEQLQSVIAHELAHVRRFDAFANVFQVCVETLLFYHPAVWWLNKKIRAEREHCCDDVAVSICDNAVEYARALTLMEEWRGAPALAMAANGGPLTQRIVRLLGLKTPGSGLRGSALTGSVLCLTVALLTGNALFGMAHSRPQFGVAAPAVPPAPAMPGIQAFPALPAVSAQTPPPQSPAHPAQPPAASNPPAVKPAAGQAQIGEQTAGSYIDGMKAAGLTDLTVDQLIALKIQGVTPDYVRGLHKEGLDLNVQKLIAMRVQEITPEYVQQLHASGLNPDENHLIALKVQGADAEYYQQLRQAGIDPDVDHLIALKVQGVTPEYVRELRTAGLTASVDQVIGLKVQDVTPEYLKELHAEGIDPNANEVIGLRVQDVTPEYVHEMHALGLKPSVQKLMALRVQDVTPEYVKALQAAGFQPDVNEIIGARVQGLTAEFIQKARQHGFKDLSLQKLIQLRESGVLDSKGNL